MSPQHQLRGLILSGGRGTRLRPLTHTAAKQLVPVANRPILFYVLDNLKAAGVSEVGMIICPETGQAVQNAVGNGKQWGLSVEYIMQDEPQGLAHAVKVARTFLREDPFIMYLGDNLIGSRISQFCEEFSGSDVDAMILLKEVSNPSAFGIAEVDERGRVKNLVEKPREPKSNLALVGIYMFSAKIHAAIDRIQPSWRGELEITDAIQTLLDDGGKAVSTRISGGWLDTGKKDDLLTANTVVLDDWIQRSIRGEVDSDSNVTGRVQIGSGSKIIRSKIRGPVVIGENVHIEESFVGPFTSVGDRCKIFSSVLEHCVFLENATVKHVDRLEKSFIGKKSLVVKENGAHKAYRLMIGDDSEVLL